MNVLAFDTSNQPLSVAIVDNQKIITEQTINMKRNHTVQLLPAIDEALKQANLTLDDIDRIAVADGPGSYTGLRIAVTTAKSLAWAKEIELVGISSLKLLAANSVEDEKKLVVPIFNARRGNIYTGLYTKNKEGNIIQLAEDTHIAAEQWVDILSSQAIDKKIELVGSDAMTFIEIFQEKLGDQVILAALEDNMPRASVLGFWAQHEEPVDTHSFIPTYLKLAEAEENWLKEHPNFEGGGFVEKI